MTPQEISFRRANEADRSSAAHPRTDSRTTDQMYRRLPEARVRGTGARIEIDPLLQVVLVWEDQRGAQLRRRLDDRGIELTHAGVGPPLHCSTGATLDLPECVRLKTDLPHQVTEPVGGRLRLRLGGFVAIDEATKRSFEFFERFQDLSGALGIIVSRDRHRLVGEPVA